MKLLECGPMPWAVNAARSDRLATTSMPSMVNSTPTPSARRSPGPSGVGAGHAQVRGIEPATFSADLLSEDLYFVSAFPSTSTNLTDSVFNLVEAVPRFVRAARTPANEAVEMVPWVFLTIFPSSSFPSNFWNESLLAILVAAFVWCPRRRLMVSLLVFKVMVS